MSKQRCCHKPNSPQPHLARFKLNPCSQAHTRRCPRKGAGQREKESEEKVTVTPAPLDVGHQRDLGTETVSHGWGSGEADGRTRVFPISLAGVRRGVLIVRTLVPTGVRCRAGIFWRTLLDDG